MKQLMENASIVTQKITKITFIQAVNVLNAIFRKITKYRCMANANAKETSLKKINNAFL